MALESPLLDENSIKGAKNILLNITYGSEEILLEEVTAINEFFQEQAGRNANLKWGYCKDESLGKKLSVTIIATGFESRENRFKTPVEKQVIGKENEVKQEVITRQHNLFEQEELSEEQSKEENNEEPAHITKLKERYVQLRNLNQSYHAPGGIDDLHDEPAYVRRKIKIDEPPASSDSNISRYSLYEDQDKKPEIRKNNSFLHDNVD